MKTFQQQNILFVPIPGAQFSVVRVFFKAGSNFDPAHKSGLAHITEHLVRSTHPSYFTTDAETFKEHLVFSSEQLPHDTTTALERILKGISRDISVDEFQHEQAVVKSELENNPPSDELATAMTALFGENTPLQQAIAGTVTSITSIVLDDVQDFIKLHLLPEKCSIVVSGNFNADDVAATVSRCGFTCNHAVAPRPQEQPLIPCVVQHNENESLCTTQLYWAAPPVYDFPLRIQYMIARAVVGGHADSLLPEMLRRNFSVYDTAIISEYFSSAAFTCFGYYIDPDIRESALQMVLSQLNDVQNLVTEDTINTIKQRVMLEILKVGNDPEALAWWYGEDFSYCGNICLIEDELIPQIKATTTEEIKSTIKTWFPTQQKRY